MASEANFAIDSSSLITVEQKGFNSNGQNLFSVTFNRIYENLLKTTNHTLYVHFNPNLLDTRGLFEPAYTSLNDLKSSSDKTSVTMFKETCSKDTAPSRLNRQKIYQTISMYDIFN